MLVICTDIFLTEIKKKMSAETDDGPVYLERILFVNSSFVLTNIILN